VLVGIVNTNAQVDPALPVYSNPCWGRTGPAARSWGCPSRPRWRPAGRNPRRAPASADRPAGPGWMAIEVRACVECFSRVRSSWC